MRRQKLLSRDFLSRDFLSQDFLSRDFLSQDFLSQGLFLRGLVSRVGLLLVFALSALFGGSAVAQEAGVSYKRKTIINFEDDTIEGDLKTPDGQYLEASKRIRHKTLIRIRTDFRREVLGSIADL